jgi:hypothetical protein
MKKQFVVSLGFILVLFVGCEDLIKSSISVQKPLSDSRFNGEFWYLGTGTFFSCWEFDGTNKAKWSVNTYHYIYDISIYDVEIKLENGHLWYRLWDNEYSSWHDEGVYSFNNSGNLILDGIIFVKEGNSHSVVNDNNGEVENFIRKKYQNLLLFKGGID